jgi:hypothetical protein
VAFAATVSDHRVFYSGQVSDSAFGARASLRGALLCCVVWIATAGTALGADADEEEATKPSVPNVYLDLRTTYATIPAGTLALGFGSSSLSAALEALGARRGAAFPQGLPAARSIAVDLPLTVDVTDRVSLYGGISGTTSNLGDGGWSSFDITSWNIGVQADLYQQNGGVIPTITLQSTLTQSVPNEPGATTSFNNILEFDYATRTRRGDFWRACSTPTPRSAVNSRASGRTRSAISAATINGRATGNSPAASACSPSGAPRS